jgi:4-hydroxy-2-oxoheptanedioate aldolase
MNTIRHPIDARLPEMMRSGQAVRAIFNGLPSPALVEMCAYAGFDAVIIDNEHGSADLETTEHMLRAARAAGIPALVRCLEHDIARVLDIGACGVQIPMVQSPEHARALVQRVRYPLPGGLGGQRGSAYSTRAAGFGAFGGPAHTRLSNEGLALVVMIETPQAAQQARAIASVDGVDAVFVGPNDLAHAMGHENRFHDAEVQAVIEHVIREVAAAGKCPGVLALSAQDQARYASWGARLFATVTTGIITQALKQAAQMGAEGVKY